MYKAFETYRGLVNPWSIDHVGHMNVQFYTARFDEASWQFLGRLGLSPTFLKRSGRAAVAADQRTEYKHEVFAGTLLHITSQLVVLGTKSMKIVHRMFNSETNVEVAEMEIVGVYFDTERRLPVDLPDRVREIAETMRVTTGQFHTAPARQARASAGYVRVAPRAHRPAEESDSGGE
jgi:acyl-CoA thioester hydrolase